MRLVLWHTLECPGELVQLESTAGSNVKKIEALAAAQKAGKVTAAVPAPTLLIEILALIHGDILTGGSDAAAVAIDDAALAAAVEKLAAP
ncbi:hypothetical protein Q7X28_02810 [Tsukamurella strandjordii]|uniref:HTH-type transcriptional repressor Sco4008 C-terminal domain-containing protein n=2 Tax=Tsukamurella strandjordii TaxID=147577 RepID=A0AA90SFQ5_9ACTN|nr:hypothetical protein [Tsukamurella strandjordii]MDP0396849.1 hypothetical protein [Tsukamurella strandjordii]